MSGGLLLTGVLVAFALCAILLSAFIAVAEHVGLVDRPQLHKRHAHPTPMVGGICIWLAVFAGVIVTRAAPEGYQALYLGIGALAVTGILDDLHHLTARTRLAVQIAVSLTALLWAGLELHDLGHIAGTTLDLGALSIPFTLFAFVGVINAFNMSDGLDGVSASMALFGLAPMIWLLDGAGAAFLSLVVAATCAFALRNVRWYTAHRARAFLGDAGSLTLGFVAGWFAIRGSQGAEPAFAPISALWFLAPAILDTVSTMFRRRARGVSVGQAGRDHLHHLLVRLSGSERAAWFQYLFFIAGCSAMGLVLELNEAPQWIGYLLFVLLGVGYHLWVSQAWRQLEQQGAQSALDAP